MRQRLRVRRYVNIFFIVILQIDLVEESLRHEVGIAVKLVALAMRLGR